MAHPDFLKRILLIDALTCFGCFALFVAGAGVLAPLLGLTAGFVRTAGLILLPCAMLFAWLGTRRVPPAVTVWIAIIGNLGWVGASAALIGAADLTAIGTAFVAAQAAAVLVLAVFEYQGVRRASAAA